jgi:hypothetical protein
MTTMTNEEVRLASERVEVNGLPEIPPEEFHEAIQASWKMPVNEGKEKEPLSQRPLVVGIFAGALCFALGAGAGYWAATEVTDRAPISDSGNPSGYPGGDVYVPSDPFVPR